MKTHTVLQLLAALFIAASLGGCGKAENSSYQGYIEGEYLYLAAPSSGYLERLLVPKGSKVAEGKPLFSLAIDPEQQGLREAQAQELGARAKLNNLNEPHRQSELAAMEAQVRAAQAAFSLAEKQLKQQQALAEKGFISTAKLDEFRTAQQRDLAQLDAAKQQLLSLQISLGRPAELRAAAAEVDAAEARVARQHWLVDKKTVAAPAAGEISETYYRAGEWVQAGQPVLSLLPDKHRLIRFFVSEQIIATLKLGDAVEVTCDGCSAPIRGNINFIAAQAEFTPPVIYSRGSREKMVFRVEAIPPLEQAALLRPGLPVDVRVITGH